MTGIAGQNAIANGAGAFVELALVRQIARLQPVDIDDWIRTGDVRRGRKRLGGSIIFTQGQADTAEHVPALRIVRLKRGATGQAVAPIQQRLAIGLRVKPQHHGRSRHRLGRGFADHGIHPKTRERQQQCQQPAGAPGSGRGGEFARTGFGLV